MANADAIQAKVILPGANIAVTAAAEPLLTAAGVLAVPDFLANAGGVICAAVEYRGGDRAGAWSAIEEKITASTGEWLDLVRGGVMPPRLAAETMARRHLDAAATYRRRF